MTQFNSHAESFCLFYSNFDPPLSIYLTPPPSIQLYTKYPNMAMMLALKATKPPVLDVVPRTASFSAPGQMGVYVLDSNKEATLAFTLGMVSKCLVSNALLHVTHCTLLSDMALFPVPIPVSVSCSTGPGNRTKSVKQSMFSPSCHLQCGKSFGTVK